MSVIYSQQVYVCLVPVLEQQQQPTAEPSFRIIHEEELMLNINTGSCSSSPAYALKIVLERGGPGSGSVNWFY